MLATTCAASDGCGGGQATAALPAGMSQHIAHEVRVRGWGGR
jgi:hypothetical protein